MTSEFIKREIETETIRPSLTDEEKRAIFLRADLRRDSQQLKIEMLNLPMPEAGQKYEEKYQRTLSLAKKEAVGQEKVSQLERKLLEQESEKIQEAKEWEEAAPHYSAYLMAMIAKIKQESGEDYYPLYEESQRLNKKATGILKLVPANLLSEAVLIGIQKRALEKQPLPSMTRIARAVAGDKELLHKYALVLPEDKRGEFLALIPEEQRRGISIILDSAAAKLLHQSLVEKGAPEEEQRRMVRMRLFKELRSVLGGSEFTEKRAVKILGQALGELGEDARQLLLELIRDESESKKIAGEKLSEHLPRVIKTMLDNFEDWRANDIILNIAASPEINPHLSVYLFGKLIERRYLPQDVKAWWENNKVKKDQQYNLEVLKRVVSDLGVIPSRQILEFLTDEAQWQEQKQTLSLDERIERIKNSQKEFAGAASNRQLVELLNSNENKAMIYYLLHGGEDRFNLINNYPLEKFKEMLDLISRFKINEQPLKMFESALVQGGTSKKEIGLITQRLKEGKFPLAEGSQAYQKVNFEISENAALNNANLEIGRVLGKEQLGVALLFPLYREYLENLGGKKARQFLGEIVEATTFSSRSSLIEKINTTYSDFQNKAKKDLQDNWIKLGEKMVMELTLDQILNNESVSAAGQELLSRLDAKRIDLRRISKELLVALKGESKAYRDLSQEISRKEKARKTLEGGLKSLKIEEETKQKLQEQIKQINEEITQLEDKRFGLGESKVDERFSHLTLEEKKTEIELLAKEIMALTEKSPSAIFTYLTMQVLGEQRLRESDINLIREMESHLQGPFQTITDLLTYERAKGERKRMSVGLQYLDKQERLMSTVRFADSKICCFSSSNYEQVIGHNTANKEWVASINADPLSFVISMEIPQPKIEGKREIKENIGFIFGNFGVNEQGNLALMLNGIYYAPGIEDNLQVEAILNGVEKIFKGLPIKTIAIASQHGGGAVGEKLPRDYSNELVELARLRALDDGRGNPENKIYDDLDTESDLNKPHSYGKHVWHKKIK